MKEFFNWMLRYGSYFLLFSATIALYRIRYLRQSLFFIGLFLALGVLGEIIAQVTSRLHMPNLYILHIYTIIECNLIALFYHNFFQNFYPRWLVPGLMVVFTGFAIANSALWQPLSGYNTYARSLESLLIIGLSLICFYKMLMVLDTQRPTQHPIFWINTGFLFYFAGSLFFFILSNALLKEPNQSLSFMSWGLHALLMVLMHILIGIGLWFSPRLR